MKNNTFKRGIALLLCAAMLLPNLTGLVFAADAELQPYSGTLPNNVLAEDSGPIGTDLHTANKLIRFKKVTEPTYNGRFVIVHDATDQILVYDGIAEDETAMQQASSWTISSHADAVAAANGTKVKAYYPDNDKKNYIYLGHSQRNDALWILQQVKDSNYGNESIKDGETLSCTKNNIAVTTYFGGTARYHNNQFFKGIGTVFSEAGTPVTTNNGAYWYLATTTEDMFRYLELRGNRYRLFRSYNGAVWNTNIEYFSDGTCLIYWMGDNQDLDGDEENDYGFVFLTVQDGIWQQKRFSGTTYAEAAADVAEDLADLKLRLYNYETPSDTYSGEMLVSAEGARSYTVAVGTAEEDLVASIGANVYVGDSSTVARSNFTVPYSGSTPKVSYYWVDTSGVDLNTAGDYTAVLKYRNDDGSDTKLGGVAVRVEPYVTLGGASYTDGSSAVSSQGLGATGSAVADNVYSGYDALGNVLDCSVVIYAAEMVDGTLVYTTKNISVSMGMLTYDADTQVFLPTGTDYNGDTVYGDPDAEDTAEAQANAGDYVNTNVSANTKYTGLTLSYNGVVLTEDFTLVLEDIQAADYPAYPDEGSVRVDKNGNAVGSNFASTGIADIQLSAVAKPMNKGVDLVFVIDLSGSMDFAVDSNTAPTNVDADGNALSPGDEGYAKSRLEILQESMTTMIESLQGKNVRIAISDFGDLDHYEFDNAYVDWSIYDKGSFDVASYYTHNNDFEYYNHLNFILSRDESGTVDTASGSYVVVRPKWNVTHPSYTGKVVPTVYTGVGTVCAEAFVTAESFNDAATYVDASGNTVTGTMLDKVLRQMKVNSAKSLGTNYDVGLEYAYYLGQAIKQDNIDKGLDRELVCVYLTDGCPTQYNYFSGNSTSVTWRDWLMGDIDELVSTSDHYAQNPPEAMEFGAQILLELLQTGKTFSDGTVSSSLTVPEYDSRSEYEYFRYLKSKDQNIKSNYVYRYFYTHMDHQGYELEWDYLCDIVEANKYQLCRVDENGNLVDNVIEYNDGTTVTVTGGAELYQNWSLEYMREHPDLTPLSILLTTSRDPKASADDPYNDGSYIKSNLLNPHYDDEKSASYQYSKTYTYTATAEDGTTSQVEVTDLYYSYSRYYPQYTGTPTGDTYSAKLQNALESMGIRFSWNDFARMLESNESKIIEGIKADKALLAKYGVYTNSGSLRGRSLLYSLVAALQTPVTDGEGADYETISPYAYFYNAEGKNWWAEAIKGSADQIYPVINKYAKTSSSEQPFSYRGEVTNNYGGDPDGATAEARKDYMSGFKGLDMPIYTISFCVAGQNYLDAEVGQALMSSIASGPSYYFAANDADSLDDALVSIISSMNASATRTWYVDTLGDDYDLVMEKSDEHEFSITVKEYVLDANGNRTDSFTVLETVTFQQTVEQYDAETGAVTSVTLNVKSDHVYDAVTIGDDIKINYTECLGGDGVIRANHFYYNTNKVGTNIDLDGDGLDLNQGDVVNGSVKVELDGDGVPDYAVAPETFFWIIGKLGEHEMVLEYQVELTGAAEGEKEAGIYDTNKSAVLTYINYRGASCYKDTISPAFPWKQGQVGFGYYLVDSNGNIIKDMTTGELSGSFDDSIKLTRPYFTDLLWNEEDMTLPTDEGIDAADKLPKGYNLYNPDASYSVSLAGDGSGGWTITDDTGTTYVVASGQSGVNTNQSFDEGSYGSSNTIVWFAVTVDGLCTVPDDVVVDYGLPVDIHVANNDILFKNRGTVVAVGPYQEKEVSVNVFDAAESGVYPELRTGFDTSYSTELYTAKVLNGLVHFELTDTTINTEQKLTYVMKYVADPDHPGEDPRDGYYYETVSVIPATSIYYEDNFLNFTSYGKDGQEDTSAWVTVGTAVNNAHQSEDRPDFLALPEVDANRIYGYDPAYTAANQYSLGTAKKINVFSRKDANGNVTESRTGRAAFTFSGTGFDVVSLTSNTSGAIVIRVYEVVDGVVSDTIYKTYVVDTYYGYLYGDSDNDGVKEWYVDPDADNALYQVPVMKVSLPYGTYHAVISASYNTFFDHGQYEDSSYDFYLDAVRIYNSAAGRVDPEKAHQDDNEGWPTYQELRDLLISAADAEKLDEEILNGVIFIDGREGALSVADYQNYGPNNELYLKPGQSITFDLNKDDAVANLQAVHLALKSVGGSAKAKIYAVNGDEVELTVNTATDLYYDITEMNGKTVVISNTGVETDAILSVTNIKTTYSENPAQAQPSAFTLRRSSVNAALASLATQEQLPVLTPQAPSLAFKDEVKYNLFFSVENPSDLVIERMGMLTWLSQPDSVSVESADYVLNGATYADAYGWYKASSQGISAKNMGDTLYMAAYAMLADGRYVISAVVDYSAKEYAYHQLADANSSDETKALCVALLNYGAAAQTYFGYHADALMNAELTEDQRALAGSYDSASIAQVLEVDPAKAEAFAATGGYSYMAPKASFKGAFSIKYLFTPSYKMDGEMKLYCWSEETYLAADALTEDNADRILIMNPDGQGHYTAAYDGVAAKNVDDTVFVCGVYESNGVRYSTGVLEYSFGEYCRFGINDCGGSFQALAEAAAIYCASAKALFGVE